MDTERTPLEQLLTVRHGLLQIEDWLTAHSEIELSAVRVDYHSSMGGATVSAQIPPGDDRAERFAAAVRALKSDAPLGSVTKHLDDHLYNVERDFGWAKLNLYVGRASVCEARVVGTETVRVPDPDAPMVEQTRDIVEWECRPLLVSDEAEAVTT